MFLKLVKSGVEKTSEYSMKTSLNVFLGLSRYKLDWNRDRSAIISTRLIIGKYYFLRHQNFLIFDINFFWKKSSSNFAGFSDAFFRRSETVWYVKKVKKSIHKRIKKISTHGNMLKLRYLVVFRKKNGKNNKISLANSGNFEFFGK